MLIVMSIYPINVNSDVVISIYPMNVNDVNMSHKCFLVLLGEPICRVIEKNELF